MAKRNGTKDFRMRERLIQEAARIMAEEGVRDFQQAKRKAAVRLGAPDTRNLPQNREIQTALASYQRLFKGESQASRLRALREVALEAMGFFGRFRPRLVGAVLAGTADDHSPVDLHLFAETPEEIAVFLMEHEIPFDIEERRFRFDDDYVFRPVYRFVADDTRVDLAVFDERALRHPPRSRIDGQPMRQAGVADVENLLNSDVYGAGAPLPGEA